MFDRITEYRKSKKNNKDLESILLAKGFIIHDVKNKGKTAIYNKNMQTVIIHNEGEKNGVKKGSVVLDVGGEILFKLGFIPQGGVLFEFLLKEAIKNNK